MKIVQTGPYNAFRPYLVVIYLRFIDILKTVLHLYPTLDR